MNLPTFRCTAVDKDWIEMPMAYLETTEKLRFMAHIYEFLFYEEYSSSRGLPSLGKWIGVKEITLEVFDGEE